MSLCCMLEQRGVLFARDWLVRESWQLFKLWSPESKLLKICLRYLMLLLSLRVGVFVAANLPPLLSVLLPRDRCRASLAHAAPLPHY